MCGPAGVFTADILNGETYNWKQYYFRLFDHYHPGNITLITLTKSGGKFGQFQAKKKDPKRLQSDNRNYIKLDIG